MPDEQKRKQRKTIIWLVIIGAAVMAGVTVMALRSLPPPGAEILGQPLPAEHETEPCYECHRGIPPWSVAVDFQRPEIHPAAGCADCHQGYGEPAT
ncbi:MAG: hypothetical protein PVH68_09530 [Armatimonadota bacterium]|jgi:hypothetical protein